MSIVSALLNYLKKKDNTAKQDVPEGYCPNCWGRQEYEGQFLEAVKNHGLDVNEKNPDVGWIQDYANKHLSAIALKKKDDMLVCQKCKVTFRPT